MSESWLDLCEDAATGRQQATRFIGWVTRAGVFREQHGRLPTVREQAEMRGCSLATAYRIAAELREAGLDVEALILRGERELAARALLRRAA